jgi:DNA polymerase I
MKTWLLIDSHYLCWRAHRTTGGLSHKGSITGIIYGFLRDIVTLKDLHNTQRFVFCFDSPRKDLLRRNDYPEYKAKRDVKEVDDKLFREVGRQIQEIRKHILPELGFKNIFWEKGYEADDLIASVCQTLDLNHDAVIVGADKDLYQLLGPKVCIYNPTQAKAITEKSFTEKYGVTPSQWVDVKAIAGCGTDNVPGIRGVGEVTAAKFINGKLSPQSAAFKAIVKGNTCWRENRRLVALPYEGTPVYQLQKDHIDFEAWDKVCKRLGIKSLTDMTLHHNRRKGFNL